MTDENTKRDVQQVIMIVIMKDYVVKDTSNAKIIIWMIDKKWKRIFQQVKLRIRVWFSENFDQSFCQRKHVCYINISQTSIFSKDIYLVVISAYLINVSVFNKLQIVLIPFLRDSVLQNIRIKISRGLSKKSAKK